MSYKIASIAIREFLLSKESHVLCITGSWGVGKTFAWRKVVADQAKAGRVEFDTYAYVSLFGVGSLDNLKREIFHRSVSSSDPLQMTDPNTTSESINGLLNVIKSNMNSISGIFGGRASAAATLIAELSFSSIQERIICFDDLERCGGDLQLIDVLGLANYLSEERNCKVAILLNEDKLGPERHVYDAQFEKVVDAFVRFEPSPAESFELAFPEPKPALRKMAEVFQTLGLNNIRVMKKAERIFDLLDVSNFTDDEVSSAGHTIALACYLKFDSDDDDALEKLKSFNSIGFQLRADADDAVDATLDRISSVGYTMTSKVDEILIDAVNNGFVDQAALKSAIEQDRDDLNSGKGNEAFSAAWNTYHESLSHKPAEIVAGLNQAINAQAIGISLSNLNGTLNFFEELGFAAAADEAADAYFRQLKLSHKEIDDDHFLGMREPINSRISDYSEKIRNEFIDQRDPADVIAKMAEHSGWNPSDTELLNTLSVDEIVATLDRLEGPDLTRDLRFLRGFVGSKTPEHQPFGPRLAAAFRQISRRSESVLVKLKAEGLLKEDH